MQPPARRLGRLIRPGWLLLVGALATITATGLVCWTRKQRAQELTAAVVEAGGQIHLQYAPRWTGRLPESWSGARSFFVTDVIAVHLVNRRLGYADMRAFRDISGIGILNLHGAALEPECLQPVGQVREIRELVLANTNIDDVDLAHLANVSGIERLDLSGTRIRGESLAAFKDLGSLQVLDLSGTRITDDSLRALRGCRQLRELHLGATDITDSGLKEFASLPQLEILTLSWTPVGDAGLSVLELPLLKTLGLAGTRVTDAGLSDLRRSPGLQELSLYETGVDDGAVEALNSLALEILDVRETALTMEGIAALRAASPAISLLTDEYESPSGNLE